MGNKCENCDCNSDVFDVIIIGAGAIGCSIARNLSQYSIKTLVLEQSDDVSLGASKANSGIIHGGYDEKHGTVKSMLAHRGNQMFSKLNEELSFGFKRIGSLVLAFNEDEHQEVLKLLENGRLNGVENLEILYSQQIIEKEPNMSKNVYSALYCPHTGIASPYEYTIALAENAAMNGVDIQLKQQVIDIQHNVEGFLVHTQNETFKGKIVINAAGAMADKIAQMIGAADFSIVPRKGEYIILNKSQGTLAKHVLFPVPDKKLGKGILVSPTYHGNLLLGPTSRDTIEERLNNEQIIEFIVKSALKFIPAIDPSTAITSYTGSRAKCSRQDFIIEESVVPGFINVAGIDSPGLTSSPAVAERVVAIVKLSLSRIGIELKRKQNFNPKRNAIIVKKTDAFHGAIDHSNPHLNIICRCERVTEAEIIDSIHRPIGAHDTDAVKRRTRAGMGPCQGNFCEPRVAKILAREWSVKLENIKGRAAGSSILWHRRVDERDRDWLKRLASKYSKL